MSIEILILTVLIAGGFLLLLVGAAAAVKRQLHICEPNQVLIFSGRSRTTEDGHQVGFRVIRGGRAFAIPLIEKVDSMDVGLMTVTMSIQGAYSDGGIPLNVNAVANVKVSDDEQVVGNAIERFLGRSPGEMARVAKETLEGHLRGVIATLTPEEVNEDRLKFAERLVDEAGADLRKLGLQLDTLKIQQVADDRNYLDSIGRKRIAEIVRMAEVAESDAVRAAEEAEAGATARAGVAGKRADAVVQKKENELRTIAAELDARARTFEEQAEAAAARARAEAEKDLHEVRGHVEELRLRAEVEVPADIERQVQELRAAGQAAVIEENGRAAAQAFTAVSVAIKELGADGMDIVVAQNLDTLMTQAAAVARGVRPANVTLLDGGDGNSLSAYVSGYPTLVRNVLNELGATLGVDVGGFLSERPEPTAAVPPTVDTRDAA